MSQRNVASFLTTTAIVFILGACGSGSTDEPDLNFGGEEGVASLYGTMFYDGELAGQKIVIGLTEYWPLAGPPKEFIELEPPTGGFPSSYLMPISYTGVFYVIAYLDVDPDDSAIFNADIDPMMLPLSAEDTYEIVEGQNQVDLVFLDANEVDWWWQ